MVISYGEFTVFAVFVATAIFSQMLRPWGCVKEESIEALPAENFTCFASGMDIGHHSSKGSLIFYHQSTAQIFLVQEEKTQPL